MEVALGSPPRPSGEKMIETRFLVERAEEGRINIRDRHTGPLFSFPISDRKLGPTVGNEYPVDETARGKPLDCRG
jgi:hypothetical protein